MSKWNFLILTAGVSLVLSACSGDDGNAGQNGTNALITQTELPSGNENCLYGGTRVDSGLDADNSGILEQGEIAHSHYICSTDAYELQLLHFADVDGGRDVMNNVVRFSALLNKFRSQHHATLVLSSGDNWIPGPEYNVASDASMTSILGVPGNGRAHVAWLNALGVQASAFGNHEFDLGTSAVASMLGVEESDASRWPGAQFPYLSSNLNFSTDASLSPLLGVDGAPYGTLKNQIAASTVINAGGHRIGVVGATTPILRSISSPGDITILPENSDNIAALAATIQASVDALTASGIDKIILLAHMQQIAVESELATLLRNVDIIVAGGSNTILADDNDRLRNGDTAADEYPLSFESASGEPLLLVNTDGDYTYLGRLLVTFDNKGVIIPSLLDSGINGAYATDETAMVENSLASTDAIDRVQEISSSLNEALAARAGNVFGLTNVYLNGARDSVRTEETNLGNLTAEANLAYAQQVDASTAVSIKNGGGIRDSIGNCIVPPGATGSDELECRPPAGIEGISEPGQISQLDLEISLRFNNSLSLITLTGAQLKQILEHGVAATADGATPGQFPQVAGIRFAFDPAQTAQTVDDSTSPPIVASAGSRIRELMVLDSNGATAGGEEVSVVSNGELDATAATQEFRVVTLGFLAGGGDRYPFPVGPDANLVELETEGVQTGSMTFADDGTEQDALAEYLDANFPADDDEATPAYGAADTPAAQDSVIENLSL